MTQASNQTWAQGHALTFGSWDVDVGEKGPRSKGGVAKMARRLRWGLNVRVEVGMWRALGSVDL